MNAHFYVLIFEEMQWKVLVNWPSKLILLRVVVDYGTGMLNVACHIIWI